MCQGTVACVGHTSLIRSTSINDLHFLKIPTSTLRSLKVDERRIHVDRCITSVCVLNLLSLNGLNLHGWVKEGYDVNVVSK